MIGAPHQTCPHCGNLVAGGSHAPSDAASETDFLLSEEQERELASDRQLDQDLPDDEGSFDELVDVEATDLVEKERIAKQLRVVSISWVVLVVLVVTVVIYFNQSADEFADGSNSSQQEAIRQSEAEKQALKFALPKCMSVAKDFLNAKTASAKAQFVYDGVRLSREMEAYYAKQPDFPPSLLQVRPVHYHWLNIPGVDAIGTICQSDTGERIEAIFIREAEEWKIEWKSLVRYSQSDWSLFTSKANGDEAEFRLYMRVMDVGEDLSDGDVLVQFYKPDIFRGHMFDGYASESIRVPIYSMQGKLLGRMSEEAALDEGRDDVGMQISDFDPQHFHRVRVRMKLRMNAKQEPYVELVRILANHWYDPAIVQNNGLPK
jgi:hypothetical protein